MNTIKLKIIVLLLFTASFVFGQPFRPGSVTFETGEVRTGFLQIPTTGEQRTINFKNDVNDRRSESIRSDALLSLVVESEDENKFTFVRTSVIGPRGRVSREAWLLVLIDDYVTLYFTGGRFQSDRRGNVVTTASAWAGRDLPTFSYFLRKRGEERPVAFAQTSPSPTMFGLNNELRRNARLLLSDYPELVEQIENGEFRHTDVVQIIQLYNDHRKRNSLR